MIRRKIIKDAFRRYKLLNPKDSKVTPYKKHKKGIKKFMKTCKEFEKYNPYLRIEYDDTSYEINDYKNIERFVVFYDYEDNEEFFGWVVYKTIPKGLESKNVLFFEISNLNKTIEEVLKKEKT